jgi:TolA-binding protein
MFPRILVCSVAAAMLSLTPAPSSGASKEIQELQRDVAQLQDQIKQLQQNQDRQLGEIRGMVQQAINGAQDASRAVAGITGSFQENLRVQESKVVAPVVGLNTRMDQMSQDMRTVQQAIGDLTGLLSKMQTQLSDLNNAIKVIQAPPAPPPGTSTPGPGGIGSAMPPASNEAPTISAIDLYANANRDRTGGKLDLALQEYADYLRWYGNTDLAPNAQYYIASIHASQGDYEGAIREYDMVLEKYSDNNKTPDAIYGKGIALTKTGRRTEGAREFQELIKRFPNSALAAQACTQLGNLGLRCTAPGRGAPAGSKRTAKK